ncbi:glycosyltransferase family 2 protein [Frigoribacterium sp. PvP032]|uniref:glycosyltransferase family 2 protein n=1 Tax=Frigoribacterium sp. PvP032 TaxID=2806589 RepID=UPI001AE69DAF|nr:glycosyltransferase family 2 protein [Frigoribacterium sp. PvP032]MBP1190248.1 glycosyltransferase involved in cell wall biosynthesis [Frigoribacterium sp. PvP032]
MNASPARRILGAAGRVTRRFRGEPRLLTVEDRQLRWARRIVEFEIVDREFVEVLVSQSFSTDDEAVHFVVSNDGTRGLTISPLVEPEWLRAQLPDGRTSWYDFLHQEQPVLVQTSPVFDAARWAAAVPEPDRPGTTLDALRHFLQHARPDTPMPVPEGRPGTPPTWSEYRKTALDRARSFAGDQVHMRRRYRSEWNGLDYAGARKRFAAGLESAAADAPRVSIILPTRDRREALGRAVASVQAQTWTAWQLVIVDDGSTDGSSELITSMAASDHRITVVRQEPSGASAARNTGLRAADGELVAFLDSDNTWFPTYLEIAVGALYDGGHPAVHSGMRMLGLNNERDSEGTVSETYRGEDGSWDDLLAGNFVDLNALLVTRAAAAATGDFDVALRRWIDYDYVLRLSRATGVPAYVPHLGVDYDNTRDGRRISSSHGASWQDVAVAPSLIDWSALEAGTSGRREDLVSVVVPVFRDWQLTRAAVEAVLRTTPDELDVEIVIIDNASPRAVSAILDAWFSSDCRVRLHRVPRNLNFGLGSDLGLAMSRGARVVMLNNDTEVQPGWLPPLVGALDDEGVLGAQSLLLYPDGTVQAAGTVFGGDKVLPWHFLAHHPRADAERAGQRRFRAVTAAAAAFRAGDLIRWRGFDPVFANGLEDVDLCLRALDDRPGGHFAVVLESLVVHHESKAPGRDDARIENRRIFDERWRGRYPSADFGLFESAGLEIVAFEPGEPRGHATMVRSSRPVVVRRPRLVEHGSWAGRPSLRWALKADSTDARAMEDVYSLRRHLVGLGQEVVVDDLASFYRSSCGLDDVTLLVTGARAPLFVPQPGAVNVLWLSQDSATDEAFAASFALQAGPGARTDAAMTGSDSALTLAQDAMAGVLDRADRTQTVAE